VDDATFLRFTSPIRSWLLLLSRDRAGAIVSFFWRRAFEILPRGFFRRFVLVTCAAEFGLVRFIDPAMRIVDRALAVASDAGILTGEMLLRIQCHADRLSLVGLRIVALATDAGARLAEPCGIQPGARF